MKKVYLLLGLYLFLTACPMDRERSIWVSNNSKQIIVVTVEYILPDTLLPEKSTNLLTININQSRFISESDVNDIYRIDKGERITLFILSKDSVETYSWEHIRKNNIILKRYEFNRKELEEMGGIINYP